MSRTRRSWLTTVVALCTAGLAIAQDERRVAVRITSVAGRSVFFDRGRAAGLVPGSRVELLPPGAAPIEVLIVSSSTNNARADLPAGIAAPPVGTPGEAWLESSQGESASTNPTIEPRRADPTTPERPPWQVDVTDFDPAQPLLTPYTRTTAADRPTQWSGRVHASLDWSHDAAGGRSSDWYLARVGTRFDVRNPFGAGGELDAAFDFDRRGVDLARNGDDYSDSRARLERLSYTWGDQLESPTRVQLGRFYSRYTPEFGLLDGIEGVSRPSRNLSFGGSAGALPRPFPSHDTGDDVALQAFCEWTSSPDRPSFIAAAAFQKTWHHGDADRDLLSLRLWTQLATDVQFSSQARLDYYTSGDTIKGTGVELSESYTSLRYAPRTGFGASITHTHYEWPELLRREYQLLPVDLVARGRLDRVSTSAWVRCSEQVRVRGRLDGWDDQNSDGTSWEVDVELDGVLEERTWLRVGLFRVDGSFASGGPGLRLDARRRFEGFGLALGYDRRDYDRTFVTGSESFTSQRIHAGLDWTLGSDWQLDCTGEVDFGDGEDAYRIGVYSQFRF